MTTHETATAGSITLEEFRQSLAELRARDRELEARKDRDHERAMRELAEIREQQKETDRIVKETALQMKETDRRLKRAESLFNTQWGKLMESLVEGDIVALLKDRGIEVRHTQEGRLRSRRNGKHFEVDILAENGREVVVVEVKTTLKPEHVRRFVSRLPEFAEWFPAYRDKRVLGGVAYLRCDKSLPAHAERQGLFVIRATGNSASIVNAPDFVPRIFS